MNSSDPLPAPAAAPDAPAPVEAAHHPPRTTARRVLVADKTAGAVVRVGGVMVIVAVVGILVFLVATVLPLFRSATVRSLRVAGRVPVEGRVHLLLLDEYRLLAAAIGEDPKVVFFRPDTGRTVHEAPLPGLEGGRVAAARGALRAGSAVVATTDGRLALLDLGFVSDFLLDERAAGVRSRLKEGEVEAVDDGVVLRVPGGHLRRVRPRLEVRGSARMEGAEIVSIDYTATEERSVAVALDARGRLLVLRDPGGGTTAPVEPAPEGPPAPADLFSVHVDEEASVAWAIGREGAILRVDVAADPPVRREVRRVDDAHGRPARLTASALLLGGRSLLLGDVEGAFTVWSLVRNPAGESHVTALLHRFDPLGSAVRVLAASPVRRGFYAGHEDGSLTIGFATNERVVAREGVFTAPVEAVSVGAKDDGVLLVGPSASYRAFDVENPHPETNVRALFRPVHYEGYDAPAFEYQSSSGAQEAEPKLSLTPLVYGTLKATFYAMLFAVPLALLAALYTSEFMHKRTRAFVKPGIEVMASLPSVVLGFVAALVLAPAIAQVVPAVFAFLFALPVVGFVTGVAWHLLPPEVRFGLSSTTRLLIAIGVVAALSALAFAVNAPVERYFFGGDFKAWLRGETIPGTRLLGFTLAFFGLAVGLFFAPRLSLRLRGGRPSGLRTLLEGAGAGLLLATPLALLAPAIERALFGDFRTFLTGAEGMVYDQRNALVVGIAMGFAVIPIIYTIAEDALSAIPESLRSASLACGASPWQTAIRIVVPAAVPGIFSAVMIGLGRAVGETMIVLMATGGTPIMDGSIFNGFRTLSQNVATELPEAPQGGTLYRVLFLAGLLLFALTFVLNTVAEVVRLRFRRKFRGL